jgi:Plasmid rolling circle replication initiator protein and truncated derivatives
MDQIANDYEFLFLTLTVPNCTADELVKTLNAMSKAWIRFTHYAPIKRILKGFFKALEITYNLKADTYHPHFHNVLAVPKRYFKEKDYLKRDEWLRLWQKAMNDDSITQVDIRRARGKIKGSEVSVEGVEAVKALASAIAEIAKYAVKSSDYLFQSERITDKVVSVLVPALSGRRLCSFGGCFQEVHQALQLDDAEDGDLVHVNNELRSDLAVQIYRYGWSCGAYKLIEIVKK